MTERRNCRLATNTESASRQMNRERRALADFRLDRQSSIMTCQYVLDDRKAKARAFLGPAVFDIDAVETLRDAWNVFLGNTGAVVSYGDVDTGIRAILTAGDGYGNVPA